MNKRKPNVQAKHGRPQRDQVWLWGVVLHGHLKTHFIFRVLRHPADAFDGKPRGHREMSENLKFLGLRKGDIFVSDEWRATAFAMKSFRKDNKLTERNLRHEFVNHSACELVNQNGFSTNAIECKWSVIKRWIRKRVSGKLPTHADRQKWSLLIDEYQARTVH